MRHFVWGGLAVVAGLAVLEVAPEEGGFEGAFAVAAVVVAAAAVGLVVAAVAAVVVGLAAEKRDGVPGHVFAREPAAVLLVAGAVGLECAWLASRDSHLALGFAVQPVKQLAEPASYH